MKQQTQTNKIEWKEVALGNKEYFEILSSGIKEFSGEKDYLSTESVQGTKIKKIESKITNENKPSRANMQPVLNSVWFAKMKSTIKVYSFSDKNKEEIDRYILSTGFAGLKFDKEISSEYVKFFFLSKRFNEEKDKLSTGSTQSGINNSFLAKIKISLPFLPDGTPNLKEQERIVSILEKAETLKQKGKNAGDLLNEYLKSVFWEMFEKDSFSREILNNNCDRICVSYVGPCDKYYTTSEEGVPMIKTGNLKENHLDLTKLSYVTKEFHKQNKKSQLHGGDLLIARHGTNGQAALVTDSIKEANCLNVVIIRTNKEKYSPLFLQFLFNSENTLTQISGKTGGSTQSVINTKAIQNLLLIRPPLSFQQKFAKIVEQIEKMKESVNKTKQSSKELFDSLMSKGFRGEL